MQYDSDGDTGVDGVLIAEDGRFVALQIVSPARWRIRRTLSKSRQPFATPRLREKLKILAVMTGMSLDEVFDYVLFRGVRDWIESGEGPIPDAGPLPPGPRCRRSRRKKK
jgi:hypothetical protein